MRKRNARDHRQERERGKAREREREKERERKREMEYAPWGMMAKLLRAVSQLGWLARCVSVRFVRRLTAWSRRDKARPTLPLGFCSGLISYPPAPPGHPRRYAVRGVFRDSPAHRVYLQGAAYDLELVFNVHTSAFLLTTEDLLLKLAISGGRIS